MIAGGGNIGKHLSENIRENYQVKVIESNEERADYLSEIIDNVNIINADSSNEDILLDDDEKPSLLMVVMKQWQRLDKIISIFTHAEQSGIDLSKIPTLIIDDEADHYSLDTKSNSKTNSKDKNSSEYYIVEQGDTLESISEKKFVPEDILRNLNGFKEDEEIVLKPGKEIMLEKNESTTHRRIKRLRQLLPRHTFLGYTATPMANFLISTVNNLSPKSGTVLAPGSLYTGAKYFFGTKENKSKHVKLVTSTLKYSIACNNFKAPLETH